MEEEKSKMEKIKEFIETCPLLDGDKINVDYLDDEVYSYSIDRTPSNPDIKNFIDGSGGQCQLTFDFTVTAPISSRVVTNLANSKFGEDFIKWIKQQEYNKNYPDVEGAFSIKCTSPNYILQKTETVAIYIIQMCFTYYELL